MKNSESFEVIDIVERLFNVNNFEDYFNNNVPKNMQISVLNECVNEIKEVLIYCLEKSSLMLPSDEKDVILDKELEDEIRSLPNFYVILQYLFKTKDDIRIINTLNFPQFYYGFKKCNNKSDFVNKINKKLDFVDEEYLYFLRNDELGYIISEYHDNSNLSRLDIEYLLHFISNYTYDDSFYIYLKDKELIGKYDNIINNIFINLLKEKNRNFKIGRSNVQCLLINLLRMTGIDIQLKYDLLLNDNELIEGGYRFNNGNEFIVLNIEMIDDIFYKNLFLIESLFHESRHYNENHNKILNYNNIQFIKDDNLIEYIDNYYDFDMNYDVVSVESDARLYGRINFHKWLKKVSPELALDYTKETKEIIQRELKILKNEFNRKAGSAKDITITRDELFEYLPLDTKINMIRNNSLLHYEYNPDNGKRYYTLDLIIKKFYYQKELSKLNNRDNHYLETAKKIKMYNDLIFNRTLTYSNILDDLNYYKELSNNLNNYFNDDKNLHDAFKSEIENFYINRIPILLVIIKLNNCDKNKSFGMLDDLLRVYKKKLEQFILSKDEDILDIIKQELNINNKKM